MQQIQWDDVYDSGRDYNGLSTLQIDKLCSYVSLVDSDTQPKLLDIGCGTGQLVREMFHRGYDTLGIDPSRKAIEIAKRSSKFIGSGLVFETGDNMASPKGTFDIIMCKYVMAFIPNRTTFYSHVLRHMAKEGIFVIITPQRDMLTDNKKAISIEDSILSAELHHYFGEVSQHKEQKDWWYICKK